MTHTATAHLYFMALVLALAGATHVVLAMLAPVAMSIVLAILAVAYLTMGLVAVAMARRPNGA